MLWLKLDISVRKLKQDSRHASSFIWVTATKPPTLRHTGSVLQLGPGWTNGPLMVASFPLRSAVCRLVKGKRCTSRRWPQLLCLGMSIVLAPTRPESSKSSVFSGRPGRPHGAWHAERELGIPDKQQEVEASSVFLSPDDLLQGRFPFSGKLAAVYAHNNSSILQTFKRIRIEQKGTEGIGLICLIRIV